MTDLYAWAEPDLPTFAYLVIWDRGGQGYAGLDEDRAHEYARNTEGVVVRLPVIADYRPETTTGKEPS